MDNLLSKPAFTKVVQDFLVRRQTGEDVSYITLTSSFLATSTSTATNTYLPATTSSVLVGDKSVPTTLYSATNLTIITTFPTTSLITTTLPVTTIKSSQINTTLSGISTSSSNSTLSPAPTATNGTLSDNTGLSNGAVTGISIGTFIAGALIALVGACLFVLLRRRKGPSYSAAGEPGHYGDSGYSQEVGPPMKEMKLDKILLEPVPSSDITTDMSAIDSQILQHVDNNYHLKPIDGLPTNFTETLITMRYSNFTGTSIELLGRLLVNIQTRRGAIRHLISYFIFSRIALTCDVDTSLLPSHIIAFLRQMPPPEKTSGSREAFDQALTKWRLLSAYLLQTVRSNRDPLLPKESDIQAAISRNMAMIRPILIPFVIPGAERRQTENLQGLMAEGARFGLLLFQQPASWVVDWDIPKMRDVKGGSRHVAVAIVLFPGLVKTADEEGRRYGDVKIVLPAEVLHI